MNPPLQQASISPPASVLERVYENACCARLTIQVLTHARQTASPSQMTFLDSYLQAEADMPQYDPVSVASPLKPTYQPTKPSPVMTGTE